MPLVLSSSAFVHDSEIPSLYTCEGRNISPPLRWSGIPSGTQSLVFILNDPDAPDPRAPKTTWVHWILYNLPSTTTELAEALDVRALPPGTGLGLNDWKKPGYGGPCPPIGRHRYFHRLYALSQRLPDLGTPTQAQLEKAMKGHVLEQAELVATYQKKA